MIKNFLLSLKNKKSLIKNRQKGQILIIFLLILVVGLALVLSVASRSITDIRLTTTSDESNRAYFAAEAGIEEALKRLQTDPTFSEGDLDFTSINQTTAKIKASSLITLSTEAYEFPSLVAKDEVVQISLLDDFNIISSPSPVPAASPARIDIFWGAAGTRTAGGPTTWPAILVTILSINAAGDTFSLEKYTFDPASASRTNGFCGNTFAKPFANIDTNIHPGPEGLEFDFHQILDLRLGIASGNCSGLAIPEVIGKPVLARIRLLYSTDDHPVAVKGDGWNLPNQGSEVESTGTTTSGVTRKLKVTQQYSALPSIFDYVLFSGGDLIK